MYTLIIIRIVPFMTENYPSLIFHLSNNTEGVSSAMKEEKGRPRFEKIYNQHNTVIFLI